MAYTVDELVIDDSFIAYCTRQNAEAIAKWDDYLYHHPEALQTVDEARQLVLKLKLMLKKEQQGHPAAENLSAKYLRVAGADKDRINRKPVRRAIAIGIAASLVILIGGAFIFKMRQTPTRQDRVWAHNAAAGHHKTFVSHNGEIKTIWLPDSTKVTLNAESFLETDQDYGIKNRNAHLEGEAFFEVAHNKALPFIVDVTAYKVEAVGTKFNIKAYKHDASSETALVEGKVRILLPGKAKDNVLKTLAVNQKFVFEVNTNKEKPANFEKEAAVKPLLQTDLPTPVETAWMDNYLVFEDQTLGEIKNILERKYDVKIEITDATVAKYKYTGSFQNESIDDILKALQISYPFTYYIKEHTITIKK
ncbi:MAG: DUF4974 domain-containing protein [Niabella sp.]